MKKEIEMEKKGLKLQGYSYAQVSFMTFKKGDKPWNTIRAALKGNWKEVGCAFLVDSSGSGNGIY